MFCFYIKKSCLLDAPARYRTRVKFFIQKYKFAHIEKNPKLNNSVYSLIVGRFFGSWMYWIHCRSTVIITISFILARSLQCGFSGGERVEGGKVESVAELFFSSPYFLIVCSTEKWEVDARNNNKVGSRRRDGFLCAISTLYAENCVAWMESGSPAAVAVAYLIVVETGVDLFGSFFLLYSRYGSVEGGGKIDDEKLVEELRGLTQKQNWDLSNLWLLLKAARGQRCRLTAVSLGFCVWIWIMMEKMRIFLCVRLFCTSLRILSRFFLLSYLMFSFWAETQENLRFQNHIVCRRDNIILKLKKMLFYVEREFKSLRQSSANWQRLNGNFISLDTFFLKIFVSSFRHCMQRWQQCSGASEIAHSSKVIHSDKSLFWLISLDKFGNSLTRSISARPPQTIDHHRSTKTFASV